MLQPIVMSIVIVITLAVFGRRVRNLVDFLRLGARDDRVPKTFGMWLRKAKDELVVVLGQRKLLQWGVPGFMHFVIFWGFLVLLTTIIDAFGEVYYAQFQLPWIGTNGFLGALQDTFVLLVLLGVLIAFAIRRIQRPGRFKGSHLAEAEWILIAIAAIMVAILGTRATALALGTFPYNDAWTYVTTPTAHLFDGMSQATREAIHTVFLWWHDLLVLGFLIYITYSKHLHILTAVFNVAATSNRPKGALAPLDIDIENLSEDDRFGAAVVTDLSWKSLLDAYTCTECGRCQSQCPAWTTGKPLSPKLLIMDIRDSLFEHGEALIAARREGDDAYEAARAELPPLNPDVIEDEVIWDCTTCGACVQACPVNIEHIDAIVEMRRNLVMMESRFPREMQSALQSMETTGNPWGQPPDARVEWTRGSAKQEPLEVPHISQAPDADVLFWVGCAGAYDDRNKKVVYDFARLMQKAGVKFATLGPDESCNGDPARRMGAEHIYHMLAEQAVEQLNSHGVRKIVTTCPHCFNTLFNEYPQFGGHYEVIHHTEFLAQLVAEGRLVPSKDIPEKITYHVPCYLARHNDVWKGARQIIETIPMASYTELHRHGHSTFCCGAGGGRMWMEERMGRKVNIERTDEALASASDTLAVGCPFCNIMLSDGITERHADSDMKVRDIAQILLETVDFAPDGGGSANGGHTGDDERDDVAHPSATGDYPATQEPQETSGETVGRKE